MLEMKMNTCQIYPKYYTSRESQIKYQSYTCDNILELADLLLVKQEQPILPEHLISSTPCLCGVIIAQSLVFCVVSCRSLFVLSSLFFLPYHYLFFIDLRIFIILLISSNVSLIIVLLLFSNKIRVITKLPNSEQSNKGKVKTHKYINRQNQSATGKL